MEYAKLSVLLYEAVWTWIIILDRKIQCLVYFLLVLQVMFDPEPLIFIKLIILNQITFYVFLWVVLRILHFHHYFVLKSHIVILSSAYLAHDRCFPLVKISVVRVDLKKFILLVFIHELHIHHLKLLLLVKLRLRHAITPSQ